MWTGLMECRSFQESEELTLPLKSGCGHVFIANWIPTAKVCFCPECKMEVLIERQYGMMSKHLEQENPNSPKVSISSSAGSRDPAKESALQDMEKAWKMSEADYFSRSCAWPKKSSPSLYFWKTSPLFPQEVGYESLEKLPKWGMIVDGVLYPLHPWEPCIVEKDGSYWLTPTTMDHLPVRKGEALENALYRGKDRKSRRKVSGRLNEQVAYPVMWPTPAARDWKDSGNEPAAQARKSPNLPAAVKMWPTPCANDDNKSVEAHMAMKRGMKGGPRKTITSLNVAVKAESGNGAKLCPRFVELLMGFPEGWTELKPLETQWCHPKLEKLFASCRELHKK